MSYEEALKYDKRKYFQYYLSLLRMKHILFLAFYSNNDYNSPIIKKCLFFFLFSLYLAVNALFFTDDTIHKIHIDYGKFDLIYELPQILYSTIISSFIHALIKYFTFTERNILTIKKEKHVNELYKIVSEVKKCIIIKFVCFYIFSFIFLLIFWYYISCFCAVYKNTQLFLIKDTLIGFIFSLIYPFGFYLLPGFFRIPSLKSSKSNNEHMYNFSKVIQML